MPTGTPILSVSPATPDDVGHADGRLVKQVVSKQNAAVKFRVKKAWQKAFDRTDNPTWVKSGDPTDFDPRGARGAYPRLYASQGEV